VFQGNGNGLGGEFSISVRSEKNKKDSMKFSSEFRADLLTDLLVHRHHFTGADKQRDPSCVTRPYISYTKITNRRRFAELPGVEAALVGHQPAGDAERGAGLRRAARRDQQRPPRHLPLQGHRGHEEGHRPPRRPSVRRGLGHRDEAHGTNGELTKWT